MANKNLHETEVDVDQTLLDLGFTEHKIVGTVLPDATIVDLILSESASQYELIQDLLTTETESDLTKVKKAFILPLHDLSSDRLKAALKEHNIGLTNDFEKADFIIPHFQFYDKYAGIEHIPQTKLMFHLVNGYFCNDHRPVVEDYHKRTGNDVLLEKRSLDKQYQYRLNYTSSPYDSFYYSKMVLAIAKLVQDGTLAVIETDTILNQSANKVTITEQLLEDLQKMCNYHSNADDVAMAGKIIPTLDPTGQPYLLYTYARKFLGDIGYKFTKNKDVQYWLNKYNIDFLSRTNPEGAIKHFEEKGQLDNYTFRALEVECRKDIRIDNRELYTFTVQVKPEYRKYMQDAE